MSLASLTEILARIPGPATNDWPSGEPFADALRHGTMSVEVFAPRGSDNQTPHDQDELYVVVAGAARFSCTGKSRAVVAGDVIFVPARAEHRFHDISSEFVTWVIFWGPQGGEADTTAQP